MAEQIEILRDRWGIAHVYGASEEAALYGGGYAMAEDRIFQMALRRRAAAADVRPGVALELHRAVALGLGQRAVDQHPRLHVVKPGLRHM